MGYSPIILIKIIRNKYKKMLGFVKSLDILNSEISQRDENKNFGILTFDYRGLIESEVLLQKKCSEYFEKLNQKNPSQSLIQKQS